MVFENIFLVVGVTLLIIKIITTFIENAKAEPKERMYNNLNLLIFLVILIIIEIIIYAFIYPEEFLILNMIA
ncbi:MAG: hypothetical protein J6B01_01590 [Ruminococcus sp.]|nr:hypothetical protein [Ruminococcus sp.]